VYRQLSVAHPLHALRTTLASINNATLIEPDTLSTHVGKQWKSYSVV